MRGFGVVRPTLIGLALLSTAWIASAQPRDEAAAVIARVGERLLEYYQRAQRLVFLKRSTVLPIDSRWNPQGMARTVDSELRIELEMSDGESFPEARVSREVLRVNGRAPRESDRTHRAGCTDPNPISPDLSASCCQRSATSTHSRRCAATVSRTGQYW